MRWFFLKKQAKSAQFMKLLSIWNTFQFQLYFFLLYKFFDLGYIINLFHLKKIPLPAPRASKLLKKTWNHAGFSNDFFENFFLSIYETTTFFHWFFLFFLVSFFIFEKKHADASIRLFFCEKNFNSTFNFCFPIWMKSDFVKEFWSPWGGTSNPRLR